MFLRTHFTFALILLSVLTVKAEFKPRTAYLDNLEDDDAAVTVFSNPKINWKNCTRLQEPATGKEYCKEALGWPDRNSTIKIIAKRLRNQMALRDTLKKKIPDIFQKIS